jgi:23S rRNA pseudouridine1911/1915/1917 synthase
VNALLFHVKDLSGIGGELRPGIVHRLDKDTSGVMVIAKNDGAHRALTSAWPKVKKEYLAIVYGKPKRDRGSVDAPIGRDPRNRKRMAVLRTGGRPAVTDYVVEKSLKYVSLLRCTLRSGRTHQIRVHLKHLGHPLIGDALYSGPQWRGIPDKRVQKTIAAFPRQALHAFRITLPDGRTFEAPMPEDMVGLLHALGA